MKWGLYYIYIRVASFPFSERSNSPSFCDYNFHCILGFYATFLRNAISKSTKISRVCLPISHWQINYEVFVKVQSNFTSRRFLMMKFTLKYSKNNDFQYFQYFFFFFFFFFFFCFWVSKTLFLCDFLCFPFCTQFPWFFCVFRIMENLPP